MMGMNSRQMQAMMRKMGVSQVDIEATEVIIKTPEGDLVFESPQVAKVNMMGQETYQIVGHPHLSKRDETPEISQDDIDTVVSQTQVSEEQARESLEKHKGDIAAAILELGSE